MHRQTFLPLTFLWITLGTASAYWLSGQLSFSMAVESGIVTPVLFAVEGFSLAAALVFGPRVWVGVFLGQFLLATFNGLNLPATVSISVFNASEAILGAYLFKHFGGDITLRRIKDSVLLFGLMLLILQPLSATLGTQALLLTGVLQSSEALADSWMSWWVGNSAGQLLVTPLVLAWHSSAKQIRQNLHRVLLALIITAALSHGVFNEFSWSTHSIALVVFTPWLVFAGLFAGLFGVSACALIVVMFALHATAVGLGPFAISGVASIFDLNVFVLGVSVTAQLVATLFEERRQQELALRLAREKAEQASESKSQFLASLSHEIRTPLTSVLGISEMAYKNSTIPLDVRQDLFQANQSGHVLLNLLNNLLEYAKSESNGIRNHVGSVSLGVFLNRIVDMFENVACQKGLRFSVIVDADRIPDSILCDEIKLTQIVNNLLGNAVKFCDHGEVQLRVDFQNDAGKETLRFRIIDTGPGIATDDQERVFQAFEQVEKANHTNAKGTGLGLAISRQLAHVMGGELFLQSEINKGSEFVLQLPLLRGDHGELHEVLLADRVLATALPKASQTTEISQPRLAGLRVLVVDDVTLNAKVAAKFLEREGASVDMAFSGEAALTKLVSTETNFDVVLMDFQMPDMTGMQCVEAFFETSDRTQSSPLFLGFTAKLLDQEDELLYRSAFKGFVSKPINIEQTIKLIHDYIGTNSSGGSVGVSQAGRV